jgi:hypothetical protein
VTSFLIGPAFINVNYALPSISPDHSVVRIAYGENVKALLEAILADLRSRGYSVPKKDYVVLKTSIDVYTDLSSVATAGGQKLAMSQTLSNVFEEVPKRQWIHVLVKPRFSSTDFISKVSRIDLFICFHKNWEVFTK